MPATHMQLPAIDTVSISEPRQRQQSPITLPQTGSAPFAASMASYYDQLQYSSLPYEQDVNLKNYEHSSEGPAQTLAALSDYPRLDPTMTEEVAYGEQLSDNSPLMEPQSDLAYSMASAGQASALDKDQGLTYAQAYAARFQETLNQSGPQPQTISVTTRRLANGGLTRSSSPRSATPEASQASTLSASAASPDFVTDPDYVIAMHDFVPAAPNATCLSFRAGEIIHVLNRDETGWWDGELEGRRGWFPSNYVTTATAAFQLGEASGASSASASEKASSLARASSSKDTTRSKSKHSSGATESRTGSNRRSKTASSSARRSKSSRSKHESSDETSTRVMEESIIDRRDSCPPMMIPMVHALSLLQNAVRAHRVTHFQPSTACIISCVRSVLSTSECLSKESEWLIRFPKLASQRKKVLNELARLVNQARKASDTVLASGMDRKPYRSSANDGSASSSGDYASLPPEKLRELHEMIRLGDSVYQHVRRFLLTAIEVGVELPPDRMFPGFADSGIGSSDAESSSAASPSSEQHGLGSYVLPGARSHPSSSDDRTPVPQDTQSFPGQAAKHTRNGSSVANSASTHSRQPSSSRQHTKVSRKGSGASLKKRASRGADDRASASGRGSMSPPLASYSLPAKRASASVSTRGDRADTGAELRRQKSSGKQKASSAVGYTDDDMPSTVGSAYGGNAYSMDPTTRQISNTSSGFSNSSAGRRISTHSSQTYHSQGTMSRNYPSTSYRKTKESISSVSSASSYESGSQKDFSDASSDLFPVGSVTTAQALAALRLTHDRLLSVIAAFIGHIHSHSRSSHASSKGHLIEMTRKTVDQVRYLLTLVDAVEETPEVQRAKPREVPVLKNARVALYNATNLIVEAVKDMLSPPQYVDDDGTMFMASEEEEKTKSLQAATGTLRAGGDCVTAVKLCLSRSIGEEPFVIHIAGGVVADSASSGTPSVVGTPIHSPVSSSIPTDDAPIPVTPARRHGHSQSQHYPQPQGYTHSHSASMGAASKNEFSLAAVRRPSGISEQSVDDPAEEETVRISTTIAAANEEDSTMRLKRAPDFILTVERPAGMEAEPAVQVVEEVPRKEPSSRSSGSTDVSKLSLSGSFETSPRTSVDADGAITKGSAYRDSTGSSSTAVTLATSTMTTSSENEGSTIASALEEKIIRGDLPSLPLTAAPVPAPTLEDNPAGHNLGPDYDPKDVAFNAEGLLVGATLEVLVAKMTPYSRTPDSTFSAAFYLTFRLFTTPSTLVDALLARYDLLPPAGLSTADLAIWQDVKVFPIRLRVSNVIKTWLEFHWRSDTDDEVLPRLEEFAKTHLITPSSKRAGARILELIKLRHAVKDTPESLDTPRTPLDRAKSAEYMRTIGPRDALAVASLQASVLTAEVPTPIMNRTIHKSLTVGANTALTDLDELEVARQLTLHEFALYAAIPAEELVELGNQGAKPPVNVKAISTFSTAITGWVTESILNEEDQKKRAALLKYFIKVADRCVGLNNFSTMRSILAALDSSTISRLNKTWAVLSNKYKVMLETMRKLSDHAKNYGEYRQRLRTTAPPAVPFLGLYLTDITFCREGNPSTRQSPLEKDRTLINFMKYHRLARIIQDMQRFQKSPYNLFPLPEMQKYLLDTIANGKNNGDFQDLYRRSLVIEPRQAGDGGPDAKSGKEWLGWTRSALSGGQ